MGLAKLLGRGQSAPGAVAPKEPSPSVAWAQPRTGDPVSDSVRTVLASLGDLCGHPVTGLPNAPLVPVSAEIGMSFALMEAAQRARSLDIADPAGVMRVVATLEEQVEERSDDARVWLKGLAWETRREAALAMFRLGPRGQVSGIPGDTWGYAILATAAVRDPAWERRVDATVALKRVMLHEAAETFDMSINLTAGLLLSWLYSESPDERVRHAAGWALEGIPYRDANGAPVAWFTNWLVIRAAELVREGRIEMQDGQLREQFFALAKHAEEARTGPSPELATPVSAGNLVPETVTPDSRPADSGGRVARSLDEVVGEILTLDGQLDRLATEGKGSGDPEWSRCDDRLTAIGRELHAEGGEAQMSAALHLAYEKGMRGRYVDRHWTGIGSWMG